MAKNENSKLIDYVSGIEVNATPEEVEAVQIFSKQLVEDYEYPKTHIQTHPQHRVKRSPSDIKKEYPVDIAVFSNDKKDDKDLYIVVECKKKTRKDGRTQLEDYLTLSSAYLGVWFNGSERFFLRKFLKPNGKIYFEEIPNIPRYTQRLEDIGKFTRADLKPTHNLKAIFKSIRNHLAANTVGATRDEVLAQQLINIIFCKIYDEKYTAQKDIVRFRAGIDENPKDVENRILNLFEEVKTKHPEVIDDEDKITLDTNSIVFIIGELQNYSLMDCERDVIADAFETFIDHALKGGQGQFFTPRNVVKMIVDILQPTENDRIIDPACGSGGFLIESLKYVWEQIDNKYTELGWTDVEKNREKINVATKNFRGIDKDYFLSKVAKAYMNLVGDGTTGIFCEDSLESPTNWKQQTQINIEFNSFDIILTNPPFGKSIKVEGQNKLKQFDLGHKWKTKDNVFCKGKLKDHEAPEILFIERCLQLLKSNGKMGIVLPDGIFNESVSYLRQWLLERVKIIAIIDVCKETFQPNTQTKTSLLFFEKKNKEKEQENYEIFMGIAYFCGHNRRGIEIEKDDIPEILNQFKKWKSGQTISNTKNYFTTSLNELQRTNFWIPKQFSPYYTQAIDKIKSKHQIVKLGSIATFKKGDEPGSENYIDFIDRNDTDIPFIRTGDLVNFAVNQLPDNFVEREIYNMFKQDLQTKDILFTKDGKIGITAMVTKNDKVMISSGILRIRLKEEAKQKYGITPEYLFAILSNKYTGYFQALRSTVIAATIPHLREKRIENFDIPILSADIMKEITHLVEQSFKLKNDSAKLDLEAINLLKGKFQIAE
ncbi:MAG: N-6 DNA methylase [Bacteroidales bacterium]|jgi:type I restriction enzyme M protein|nr:N-6 DNA methylase [Bacteroidales bacterium]